MTINLTPTASLFEIDQAATGPASESGIISGKITGRTWGTPSECDAAALLVHGLGAHSGWFEPIARRLKLKKVFVLAYDQLGFGRRSLEPFSTERTWFADLAYMFGYLRQLVGEKPIFLIGNSMGALIALNACSDISPSGLALLSPAFDGHPRTFNYQYRLMTVLRALLNPNQEFPLPYNVNLVVSAEAVRTWLKNDPEKRFFIPGKMLLALLKLTLATRFRRWTLSCPVLMLTAEHDDLVDNKVNEVMFQRLISPNKTKRNFDSCLHDLTLDLSIDDVAEAIRRWMTECLKEDSRN